MKKLIYEGDQPYPARIIIVEKGHGLCEERQSSRLATKTTLGNPSWRKTTNEIVLIQTLSAALLQMHGAQWDVSRGWVFVEEGRDP